jgi:excisionase family DNA binding protein
MSPLTIEDVRSRSTITVEEAADLLGIGRKLAYDAVNSGELPAIKIGTKLLVVVPKLLQILGVDEDANRGLEAGRAVLDRCHAAAEERARQAAEDRQLGRGVTRNPFATPESIAADEKANDALWSRRAELERQGRPPRPQPTAWVGDVSRRRGGTQPSPYRNKD